MTTERTLKQAFTSRREVKKHDAEEMAKKLARAVANVLDGSCESIRAAAQGVGLGEEMVSKAVKAERARRAGKEGQS